MPSGTILKGNKINATIMKCVELNPIGNFNPWEPGKLEELEKNELDNCLDSNLMFENESIKLWSFSLQPYDRLPFRKHLYHFSWTCPSGGLAISRNSNGKITLLKYDRGDTGYYEPKDESAIFDFENIGEELLEITILEHKSIASTLVDVQRSQRG